jgi:putative Ca2+/H+ antiporter (TMEM165/GDT1 family)
VTLSKPPSQDSQATTQAELEPLPPPRPTQDKSATPLFSGVLFSTFVTILLAEMGDKTQLTTLLMAAQSQSPWVVLLGAATALVATSLLGVVVGCWLANRLSPRVLNRAAGVILLLVAIEKFWELL